MPDLSPTIRGRVAPNGFKDSLASQIERFAEQGDQLGNQRRGGVLRSLASFTRHVVDKDNPNLVALATAYRIASGSLGDYVAKGQQAHVLAQLGGVGIHADPASALAELAAAAVDDI